MTIIGGNNQFGKPFLAYRDGGYQKMQLRDNDHTPYAKRPGSVDSMLNVEVTRFMPWDGPTDTSKTSGATIGISFEEITTTGDIVNKQRTAGRTISHNFPMMEALKLARFIMEAAAKHEDQAVRDAAINIAKTFETEQSR